jgi:methionine sulfoxide reductase heme-binding subunit
VPWFDYAGRFSPLRLAVFIALFCPAALVAARFAGGGLGADPFNAVIHQIGNWTIKLIFLALAITPVRRILAWPGALELRRMIGIAAFAYAAAHLALYVLDQHVDIAKVASEIVRRFYLTIGFVALVILAALAATSTDGMVRRLGSRRWRRLHQLGYAASLLAVVHFFIQTKADVDEPWVMAGLYAWLMLYRVAGRIAGADRRLNEWAIAGLGVVAGALTALGEAAYFWIKLGVDPGRVLGADLSLDLMLATGVRPAWVVLILTLSLSVLGALRAAGRTLRTRPQAATSGRA